MTFQTNTPPLGIKRRLDLTLICMVLLIIAGFVFMHDLLGETLFDTAYWDSYTMQAMAWRSGSTCLDQNYEHLELAVYNGNYYVSFPPIPSVVIFPLTFIFGYNVPMNFIMLLYTLALAIVTYLIFRKLNIKQTRAAFLSVFYVFGSNLASISMNGSVWWHAQMLCVLLCTLAIYCAMNKKRVISYVLTALSVGCRPFTALFFVLLFALYYREDKREHPENGFLSLAKNQLPCFIIPALIAVGYMAYNYVRFDNPLEFGHNYLPEFTGSEHGQFSLTYLGTNLFNLFIRPVGMTSKFGLDLSMFNGTMFDGFMFYIANPIFLIVIIRAVINLIKKRIDPMRMLTLFMIFLYIILLCCHKTLGGWQFGARYTVDVIPMALLYLILGTNMKKPAPAMVDILPDIEQPTTQAPPELYTAWKPSFFERIICIFGIMFNIYGALCFWIEFAYVAMAQ